MPRRVVVDEVVSKQLFKAHTSELLPGGNYKLVVKSRAGMESETLTIPTLTVT